MSTRLARALIVVVALAGGSLPAGAWAAASPPGGPVGQDDLEGLDELGELDSLEDLEGGGVDAAGSVRLRAFQGFGETLWRIYLRDRRRGKNDEQGLFDLRMEIDLELGGGLDAYLRPRFLIDAFDGDLVRTEPLEAYLSYGRETWDVLAGQFVENWGIADTFNPLDVMNRRDLGTDILDPIRLGELGGRFRYFFEGGDVFGEPTLSVFVIPAFRRAQLPTEDSRWSLSQEPFELDEDSDVTPKGEDRIFAALRGQSTLSTSPANADLQAVVARGPEPFPLLVPRPLPTGTVELIPVYYGVWSLGGGLRAVPNADPWSQATLKAEVVYKMPYRLAEDPAELPDDYLQYVLGVDWLFPTVFDDQDQITLTVEYLGETGADDPASEFRPFRSDLVLRMFWEANDFARTSVELRGLVDVETAELILEGIFERQLRIVHEDLKLRLGAQYFEPVRSEPGFFGFFPDNTNIYGGLRLDF